MDIFWPSYLEIVKDLIISQINIGFISTALSDEVQASTVGLSGF